MRDHEAHPATVQLRALARCSGLASAAAGALVLVGWLWSIPLLTTFGTSAATAPGTALVMLLAGMSACARPGSPRRAWLSLAAALGAMLIGAATLAGYALGIDLGINGLLAADGQALAGAEAPAHMAALTALASTLIGAGLALLRARGHLAASLAQALGAAALLLALLALAGHSYSGLVPSAQAFGGAALQTALALAALALALLCARPEAGAMRIVIAPGNGGMAARRLLPWVVVVPPALGWLQLAGQRLAWYGSGSGIALFAVVCVVLLVGLLWRTATVIEGLDARRTEAEGNLAAAHARLRRFEDANIVGVFTADADGRVLEANDYYLRLLDAGRDELGRGEINWRLFTPPQWLAADMEARHQLQAQGACELYEKEYARRTGDRVPVLVGKSVLPGGRIVGFALDITADKQAQAEIQHLNTMLEQRVQERTLALEAANKELEAFAYSVSHDLRTPLRAINGFSQALLEDYEDRLDDDGKDSLHRVCAAANHMAHLIDEMLKLSRATRGDMDVNDVDLSAMAHEILEQLQAQEPQREVMVSVAPGAVCRGDARLLQTVLQNLLCNAWKFTSRTPGARVSFTSRMHDEQLACSVADNGAGFDMAYVEKLFNPFQRLHRQEEFPGNGIGLATVKRIIGRHGGRVWAEGAVGAGATFHFTLPAAALPDAPPASSGPSQLQHA